jgi:hypothetical protein
MFLIQKLAQLRVGTGHPAGRPSPPTAHSALLETQRPELSALVGAVVALDAKGDAFDLDPSAVEPPDLVAVEAEFCGHREALLEDFRDVVRRRVVGAGVSHCSDRTEGLSSLKDGGPSGTTLECQSAAPSGVLAATPFPRAPAK